VLENKARRRDILIDEETLFAFYDERIPAEIASLASFEGWRRTLSDKTLSTCFLHREYLLARDDAEASDT
jgi:ATP-dependent helicase HrpA